MADLQFDSDEAAMTRALQLAERGIGYVEPNPAVGAVITDAAGKLIAEGWHERYGGPHAEVNAFRAAGDAARGGTLYVTLEPCCHHGKTPPCSRAVIDAGVARVVIAMSDPAPHVAGGGIRELRDAGLCVDVGVCEEAARELAAPFVMLMREGRPFVHAKWAMTLDGKIAARTGHSQWISNEQARERVHQLRGRMDAIVVGIGTAVADDPLLTARPPGPRTALRVVIDSQGRLPLDSQLVKTAGQLPVLVVTTNEVPETRRTALITAGVELLPCGMEESAAVQRGDTAAAHASRSRAVDLQQFLQELGRRGCTNLLLEGGTQLLGSFFDARLIDEVHAFVAPKLVGGELALTALGGHGLDRVPNVPQLHGIQVEILGDNAYFRGRFRCEH